LPNVRFFDLLKIDMADYDPNSFRAAMNKRGLWTLEAVPGQIATPSPQTLAQQQ
jgi:hypothetical protein